jgi:hypothetical protein
MYHPSIVYQVYKLEQRALARSGQRQFDRRTGNTARRTRNMAAPIERAYRAFARAVAWPKAKLSRASAPVGPRCLKPSELR